MNEPQTDTPKTYAEINWASEYDPDCEVVSAELSSKLEKELAAVTEQRDEALSDLEFRRDLFVLQEQQLNDVRAERDRLAEAIITHRAKAFPLTGEEFDQELWQALQSLTQPTP